MNIVFVTSNEHKYKEALGIAKSFGIELEKVTLPIKEKRGTNNEIAMDAALKAYSLLKKPVLVEDSGLFINALNGFPGEFSKWVLKKIGLEGVLKLVDKERGAYFKAVVAYADAFQIKVFEGFVYGSIAYKIKGSKGFGYDPIFIPKGYNETFAENEELKAKLSHRVKAFKKAFGWLCGKDRA